MRTLFSIVSMLLVASLIKAQGAIQTGGEESRILTLEVAWNQAVQSRDAKALRILLAPEVVYIDYDGTVMDREQYLASVDSPPNVPLQIVNESMTVHVRRGRGGEWSVSRDGREERQTLPAPGAVHRHMGTRGRELAMRGQPVDADRALSVRSPRSH